ncbi:hypothetical protein IJG72_03360 [bacterium]|nr:hypothetical protein [bacterium]
MNYKIFTFLLLITLIITTVSTCITKPKLHNKILIYNSEYIIESQPVTTSKIEVLPIKQNDDSKKKIVVNKNNTNTEKKITKVQPNNTEKKIIKNTQKTVEKVNKPAQTSKVIKKENTIRPSEKEQVHPTKVKEEKNLTQSEEEIKWNQWHSNLQNKIMQDVDLPDVPQGIAFKFIFDVDKYGKISNIKVWSTNSAYTPHAIQYIIPVIKSYQGHSILTFPQGSNRTVVHFEGGLKVSNYEKYSSPNDYNDTEKIRK